MTKHQKELQRYYMMWILFGLIIVFSISGIVGYFMQLKDHTILMVMLGETFVALMTLFGFHVTKKVSEDTKEIEEIV